MVALEGIDKRHGNNTAPARGSARLPQKHLLPHPAATELRFSGYTGFSIDFKSKREAESAALGRFF